MFDAVNRFWKNLCRAVAYARFGWSNHDWDHTFFYALLRFKLDRMQKAFENDWTVSKERTKSVRVAAKLAKRLETDYYCRAITAHDKKWGELEMDLGPPNDQKMRQAIFSRKNVTKRTEKRERLEFMAATYADQHAMERDIRWLTGIINKYVQHWWS